MATIHMPSGYSQQHKPCPECAHYVLYLLYSLSAVCSSQVVVNGRVCGCLFLFVVERRQAAPPGCDYTRGSSTTAACHIILAISKAMVKHKFLTCVAAMHAAALAKLYDRKAHY